MEDLKEVYETLLIDGKEQKYFIKGEDVFGLNYLENKWVFCGNVNQFIEYKKSIIIDLPNIKVQNGYEKLRSNKGVLERSNDGKVWRSICVFKDKGQCHNYSIKSCSYCGKHKDGIVNIISTIEKGDIIEDWLFNQLCKSDQLINVTNIGRDNGKLDITFQVKDEIDKNIIRGIQVKQLILNGKNSYYINRLKKYNKDTLIVGISEDKKYMCLIFNSFIGDLDSFNFNINNYKDKKYREYIFNGLEDKCLDHNFFDELIKCCKKSSICNDSQFNENNLKENKMMKELKEKCIENNLLFEPHTSANSPIDVLINEKKVQCKYSSQLNDNLYHFSLFHTINNKVSQPYSENDVDFFIFKHEKEDTFYIIPENVLLHFGYLKTDDTEGKITLRIAPSSYEEYYWTKQFINRFDLINEEYNLSNLSNLSNPFNKFQHKCKLNNIECIRDMSNLIIVNGFLNDKTFKLMISNNKIGKNYQFSPRINGISYHIDDSNVPDFFIFMIEKFPDDFYIFPKDILVEQKIIGTGDIKGKTHFGLPIPSDSENQKKWVFKYLNNFDLLKEI